MGGYRGPEGQGSGGAPRSVRAAFLGESGPRRNHPWPERHPKRIRIASYEEKRTFYYPCLSQTRQNTARTVRQTWKGSFFFYASNPNTFRIAFPARDDSAADRIPPGRLPGQNGARLQNLALPAYQPAMKLWSLINFYAQNGKILVLVNPG